MLNNASDNRLVFNNASESEGTGIAVSDLSREQRGRSATPRATTTATASYVGDEVGGGSGTLIERNITNNNKSYGIHVPKVSHTIKGNIANDNGSLGHLGQRGQQRPRQPRRRRQQGPGQPRPARPAHAQAAAVLQRPLRRRHAGTSDMIPPSTVLLEGPPSRRPGTTSRRSASTAATTPATSPSSAASTRSIPRRRTTCTWGPARARTHAIRRRQAHVRGAGGGCVRQRRPDAGESTSGGSWRRFRSGRRSRRSTRAPTDRPSRRPRRSSSPPTSACSTFECKLDGAGFAPCTWTTSTRCSRVARSPGSGCCRRARVRGSGAGTATSDPTSAARAGRWVAVPADAGRGRLRRDPGGERQGD